MNIVILFGHWLLQAIDGLLRNMSMMTRTADMLDYSTMRLNDSDQTLGGHFPLTLFNMGQLIFYLFFIVCVCVGGDYRGILFTGL